MKLYYAPGACSLSPHITLREAGLKFDAETVDLRTHRTKSGADFYQINPKGYVPTLVLDDGEVLTEGAAIVQYIADLRPRRKLAPKAGTIARVRLQEWLNYIATEIHKSFGPLFNPATPEETRKAIAERIRKRLDYASEQMHGHPWLMGDTFTVADAYLFTMLQWAKGTKMEVGAALEAYRDRVAARPAVKATLKAESAR